MGRGSEMLRWIKKIHKQCNSIFYPEPASDSEEACFVVNHVCCVLFMVLLLLINVDLIIAEVATPIRCAIAGDTTRVLMPVEEWQKQRGIEKLRPIKNQEEYDQQFTQWWEISELERQQVPKMIKFNGRSYTLTFGSVNFKTKLAFYESEEEKIMNILMTDYWIVYDMELRTIILTAKDVSAYYSLFMGIGPKIVTCGEPYGNSEKLKQLSYQYNF